MELIYHDNLIGIHEIIYCSVNLTYKDIHEKGWQATVIPHV